MAYIGKKPAVTALTTSDLADDIVNADKIADDAISEEHIDPTAITAMTALDALPATTDEILLSDAGVLKRLDAKHLFNRPYFQVYNSSATSIPDNVTTRILLQTATFDTDSFHNTTDDRIYVPSGYSSVPFLLYWNMRINLDGIGDNLWGSLRKNGSLISSDHLFFSTAGDGEIVQFQGTVITTLSSTDYLDLVLFQDNASGSAKNTEASANNTYLGGCRLIA